jgi:transposase
MARAKRSFSVEFRDKAVAYVVEQNKSIAAAARELGIGESTLGNWMKTAEAGRAGGPTPPAERDEMRRLRAHTGSRQLP